MASLPIAFSSAFDSGNGELVSVSRAPGAEAVEVVEVSIRADPWCESDSRAHLQWFHFRLAHVRGRSLEVALTNGADATFADAWDGYRVAASYGDGDWFRVADTTYVDGRLSWRLVPARDAVYFAFFAPYPYTRHLDLLGELSARCARVSLSVMGRSVDGRDLDLVTVGEAGEGKRAVWVVSRQHPGESMAEWCTEGLLRRLTDPADAVARALLARAVFYVVPNINPDGSVRGHLRTNAAGANLNREWREPSDARSPEVAACLRAMDATGVDLMLDVHGDEILPYNFFVDNRGVPGWNARHEDLLVTLSAALVTANPDFQDAHGYDPDAPNSANLTLGSKAVGLRYDCLAVTLEQPFKDTADTPDERHGWSPARAERLGASLLDAIKAVVHKLR